MGSQKIVILSFSQAWTRIYLPLTMKVCSFQRAIEMWERLLILRGDPSVHVAPRISELKPFRSYAEGFFN